MKMVFTAYSSELFCIRSRISKYVIDVHAVPINPFLNWDYFLMDNINEGEMRVLNVALLKRCDELWIFANSTELSDGVRDEIEVAKIRNIPVKYFAIKEDRKTFYFAGDSEEEFVKWWKKEEEKTKNENRR